MLNDILKLLPLQGVTNKRALPQGVASLALGYVLLGFQPVQACIIGIPQWQSTNSTSFTPKFQPYARLDI